MNIKKYRRVNVRKVLITLLSGITAASFAINVFGYQEWKKCLLEKQSLETQLSSYSHMVYVAQETLPKGTVLTEDMLNLETRIFDLQNIDFITEEAFGQIVVTDIEEGTCVTTEMLCKDEKNGREVFLTDIIFPEYLQSGDRIDVRIRYENAEDYTVLADKIILVCDKGNGIVLELTEEEILYISSAFFDIKKYDGARLYVATYPENCDITVTGMVNYIPNREILVLTGREKTEGESRNALETRLMRTQ